MEKRWSSHVEWEIMEIIKERGWASYRQILSEMKEKLIDPPHPVRVRDKLIRLFMKGKLDRVRIKAFTFKHGREFVYFLPDNPPKWLIRVVKEEDSNISETIPINKEVKRHGIKER